MRKQKGFILLEGLILLVIVAFIIAMMAVGYVSVVQSKNEDNVAEAVQHLVAAQNSYRATNGNYATDPTWLSNCLPIGSQPPIDATHACLVSPAFTNGVAYRNYQFTMTASPTEYVVSAHPLAATWGRRVFCGSSDDQNEIVRAQVGWQTSVSAPSDCTVLSPVTDTDQGAAGISGKNGQNGAPGATGYANGAAAVTTVNNQTTIVQCTNSSGCTTAPGTAGDWAPVTNIAGGNSLSFIINGGIFEMPPQSPTNNSSGGVNPIISYVASPAQGFFPGFRVNQPLGPSIGSSLTSWCVNGSTSVPLPICSYKVPTVSGGISLTHFTTQFFLQGNGCTDINGRSGGSCKQTATLYWSSDCTSAMQPIAATYTNGYDQNWGWTGTPQYSTTFTSVSSGCLAVSVGVINPQVPSALNGQTIMWSIY